MTSLIAALWISLGFLFPAAANDAPRAADPQWIDDKIDPCTDYYLYACGNWIKKNPLPPDRASFDRGLSWIVEKNKILLRDLLAGSVKPTSKLSADEKKGQAFYRTCIDEKQAEQGLAVAVVPVFKRIDEIQNPTQLAETIAYLHLRDVAAFFDIGALKDAKQSDLMTFNIVQAGLSLPNRDDYFDKSARATGLRDKLKSHIARMLHLAKLSQSPKDLSAAEQILALETKIAQASRSPEKMRDVVKLFNRWDRSGLAKNVPGFPWAAYFAALGYPNLKYVNVMVPENLRALEKLWKETSLPQLKLYLKWHYLTASASALGKAIDDENFAFYGKELLGRKEQSARWKRCVAATDEAMGDATGQLFVRETFSDAKQKTIDSMVAQLRKAFEQNLKTVVWLDESTRKAARKKLDLFISQIGKPDKWRSYASLEIDGSDLANRNAAAVLNVKHELDKVGNPIDRFEWEMSAPTVNAYYSPEFNKIVFLAGILQPPTFNPESTLAANYGAIGMVIGHEFTHGFDDQGCLFDGEGRMKNWWTKNTTRNFEKRADCLAKYYSTLPAKGDLHLNGRLNLGEAIGDLGGLKIAHRAMKNATDGSTEEKATKNEKDFFLAFAQTWCENATDAFEQFKVLNDPHAPNRYRVNASLQNFPAFATAYKCGTKSAMRRNDACEIW